MNCQEVPNCTPCNPDYEETGCPSYPKTGCVIYNGDDIDCLNIEKNENLNDVLQHIKDTVCALTPTAYADFDFSCFSTQGIETEQQFVELISSVVCEILGSQSIGSVTSLSSLYSSIQSLTTNLNLIKNQTLLTCFQTLSGLTTPQEIGDLLSAIQTIICDHKDRISSLESGAGALALTVNDSSTIDLTASGTANHTLTADVKISATGSNSIIANADGIYSQAVSLNTSDSSTIDFTTSGTLNHNLTASVKVSGDLNNSVEVKSDGIFVETAVQKVDGSLSILVDDINGDATEYVVSAIIDPDINNALSVTSGGLFVDSNSLTLSNNSVTNSILRDSSAYSIIGRSSNTTGDPSDIQANADQVLRRAGSGNLQFGTLVTNNIGNNQVTFGKIQNVNSSTILGRTTGGSGSIEELTIGSNMLLSGGILNTIGRTLIGISVFNTSDTWTKPAGCNAVLVYTTAGGGGGGGANASASEASVGSGGGAGATVIHYLTSGLGATETVTVGAGGTGGNSGNSYIGQNGTSSSFGSHTGALGGSGGSTLASGTSVLTVNGGASGISSGSVTGLIAVGAGQPGIFGIRTSLSTGSFGIGGASFYGGNGDNSYGAGGNGSFDENGSTEDGGNGGAGLVIVYEYS